MDLIWINRQKRTSSNPHCRNDGLSPFPLFHRREPTFKRNDEGAITAIRDDVHRVFLPYALAPSDDDNPGYNARPLCRQAWADTVPRRVERLVSEQRSDDVVILVGVYFCLFGNEFGVDVVKWME